MVISLCCLVLGAALQLSSVAQTVPPAISPRAAELVALFRPFQTDRVTLSADGRHLAYTERRGEALFLVLRDLEANKAISLPVAEDQARPLSAAKEKSPAHLSFLRWATNDWLVFNINGRNLWAIRADGTQARSLADPRDFQGMPDMSRTMQLMKSPGLAAQPNPLPGPVMSNLSDQNRSVRVVALPRGSRYAFVASDGSVVLRLDIETGQEKEWGETVPRGFAVMVDQEGYPRICSLRQAQTSLTMYADRQSGGWKPLDELLAKEPPLFFHVTPARLLEERSVPLGFDYNPDLLYFASNVGHDTFGVYALDMKTRQRTEIAVETPAADLARTGTANTDPLIFDNGRKKLVGIRSVGAELTTLWLDPELAEIQRTLHEAVPKQTVEILEWDEARSRFLVQASSQIDPGTYYVFHREEERLDRLLQRAPWLTPAALNPAISFRFQTPGGVNLTGYLTLPRITRLKLPPLVVLCHDGPWSRDYPGFDRQAQALAAMGFAVVQVNYRGSTGFGRKHLEALRAGFDTVALEDVIATVDWVLKTEKVDRRLVAIMGTGYGGYLALRALQLYPTRFRCAVALDAPVDLPTWANPPSRFEGEMRRAFLGADTAKLEAMSPLSQPDKIAGPVMLIQREDNRTARGQDLRAALAKLGREVEFLSLDRDAAADLPQARAALFLKIEEFFNAYIYNYAVKLGETVKVK